jgi:hypothetical protein
MSKIRLVIRRTLVVVLFLALFAAFEPTHVIRGVLRGESFFDHRPTSYWIGILGSTALSGELTPEKQRRLSQSPDAIPILMQCLKSPSSKVRENALVLLGRPDPPSEVVNALSHAARDDDAPAVRLAAISGLEKVGPSAAPELVSLTENQPTEVSRAAEAALWRIDPKKAARLGGWQRFAWPQWGFAAMFPGKPEQSTAPGSSSSDHARVHWFTAIRANTRFIIGVADYPPEVTQAGSDEDRLNATCELIGRGLSGKIQWQKGIQQQGHPGRELIFSRPSAGEVRARVFWVGRRLYQVNVIAQSLPLEAGSSTFFQDSFQLLPGMLAAK